MLTSSDAEPDGEEDRVSFGIARSPFGTAHLHEKLFLAANVLICVHVRSLKDVNLAMIDKGNC